MAKSLDAKTIDNIEDSLHSTKNITKSDYTKSIDILEAAGKKIEDIDDMLGDLDWKAIISKKGETRLDHINKHMVPNPTRKNHGVFNGNAEEMVNTAWNNRHGI